MNKQVIELTVKIGKIYVQIAKLNAEKHVIEERIWASKTEDMLKRRKDLSLKNVKKKTNNRKEKKVRS